MMLFEMFSTMLGVGSGPITKHFLSFTEMFKYKDCNKPISNKQKVLSANISEVQAKMCSQHLLIPLGGISRARGQEKVVDL